MMDQKILEKQKHRLSSRFFFRRRWAIRALAADGSADATPLLIASLKDANVKNAALALECLHGLTDPAAVDCLCATWEQNRNCSLEAVLTARKYVARIPARLHVLTALKTGQSPQLASKEHTEALVKALQDGDTDIAANADHALRQLNTPERVDEFCALWERDRNPRLDEILKTCTYVARAPARLHVLTALKTGQSPQLASKEHTEALVKALQDGDTDITGNADRALRQLNTPERVDEFCALWEPDRNPRLGKILKACKYVARAPARLHVLTALKSGTALPIETEELLACLVETLEDKDAEVVDQAESVIKGITSPIWRDMLVDQAISRPRGRLARACVEGDFRHTSAADQAVFLVVTGRLDAFFHEFRGAEDAGMRLLHQAYDRGSEGLRAEILRAVRSGDRRMMQFFQVSKPRHELTETELLEEIDAGLRHKDWPQIFSVVLDAPLRYTFGLLERLANSGWQPEDTDQRDLFQQLLKAGRGVRVKPSGSKRDAAGGVTDPQTTLLELLDTGTPLQSAGAVGLLAALNPTDDVKQRIARHAALPVRAAGLWTGLCPETLFEPNDPVCAMPRRQTPEAAPCAVLGVAALDLWPSRARPRDMVALNAMPESAFRGKLGAVRAVLRLILASQMRMVQVVQDMADVDETAVTGGLEPDEESE